MDQEQRVQWMDDNVAWWVDSGATMHVCKDRCWFKTYESLNDGFILHIGNESTALVHGRSCVDLRLNIVSDNIGSAFMSTSKLNDSILWHARLGHVHFKRMQDMSKDGLISAFDMDTEKCKTCLLTKITKNPFQNVKRKTEVLELIHSDLCDLHATPSLENKKYFETFINDASRAESRVLRVVVRLPDLKLKTFSERGIECIFVGYAEHSKAFRFYVNEPNDSVAINSIIESRDAIFDGNRFSSVPKPTMKSQDVAFWKEAINDEMDSIMGNNTCILADIPPGCKPLGCKWIFKRKLKVDGTVEKFNARLVIQGFKQKSWIDYFDTYALVTAFLNDKLDEEVYMNQPQGFIMPGNENKVCKLIKKFDESGKGVIICLYVDDMLIFGTDQVQVDLTREFLSSKFSMKDMGIANVILGIRIKHKSNGIENSQSHYIERVLDNA
ncbi:zinc finger, CCHC-type containing protein [Tanacetum coccineum]|uniref:Zinc finger, CCHC-type containing protein n=1 Tax=Tanacetum coccineum TaxID=301880 RepID=A0ABQ5G8X6_9ASTR